jgi:hypothetical protein
VGQVLDDVFAEGGEVGAAGVVAGVGQEPIGCLRSIADDCSEGAHGQFLPIAT